MKSLAAFLAFLVLVAIGLAIASVIGGALWAALYAYRIGITEVDALIEQDPGLALVVILVGMAIIGGVLATIVMSGLVIARLGTPKRPQRTRFPAIQPGLMLGTSPVFDVEVRGENLLVSFGKPRQKFTFIQDVRVAAPSNQAACPKAVEMVSCDRKFRASVQNKIDDLPRLYINSIEQVRADSSSEFVGPAHWEPEGPLERLRSILTKR